MDSSADQQPTLLSPPEVAARSSDVREPVSDHAEPDSPPSRPDAAAAATVTLTGTVVDELGVPVADASVAPKRLFEGVAGRERRKRGPAVRTDAAGQFRIEGLALARFELEASADSCLGPVQRVVDLARGERDVLLTLRRGHELRVRVHWQDGSLAEQVAFEVLGEKHSSSSVDAPCDAEGVYRLDGQAAGELEVRAKATRPPLVGVGVAHVRLPSAEVLELILVPADIVLSGRVLAPDRRPLSGVHLVLAVLDQRRFERATSTQDGRFEIRGQGSGVARLFVSFEGYVLEQEATEVRFGPDEPPLELVLQPKTTLRGIVLDSAGKPLAGAAVHAAGAESARTVSVAGGLFSLSVAPGACRVSARADGHARSLPLELEIRPGASVEGLELRLRAGCTVRGRVFSATGTPFPGSVILAGDASTASNHGGEFVFELLPPGPLTLQAHDDDEGLVRLQVTADPAREAVVELRLPARAPVRTSLAVRERGLPIDARVWLETPGFWRRSSFTRGEPWLELELQTPGLWRGHLEREGAEGDLTQQRLFELFVPAGLTFTAVLEFDALSTPADAQAVAEWLRR